jgi:hypothetical protein
VEVEAGTVFTTTGTPASRAASCASRPGLGLWVCTMVKRRRRISRYRRNSDRRSARGVSRRVMGTASCGIASVSSAGTSGPGAETPVTVYPRVRRATSWFKST